MKTLKTLLMAMLTASFALAQLVATVVRGGIDGFRAGIGGDGVG